ncbi:MAG TPA: hypothetical protein DDZ88_19290 [Verrucomicrobiales bacterium]|nr:hypothetical protein [Verrucomicrobiales bacterium]
METLSIRCNHCGAPLQVAGNTRFVTCQFCLSNLEVKRTDSSVFTEEVAKIAANTGMMAESLEVLTLQNEIERLDREWGIEQTNHLVQGRTGPRMPGNPLFGLAFTIFFAVVCFGMASFAGSFDAPGIFLLVPIGMGLFALTAGIMGVAKGQTRETARSQYQMRRAEMTQMLEALKQK